MQELVSFRVRVPFFEIKLNDNASSNQYNMFIQLFTLLAQYKVMSSDTFKEAFKMMGVKDEAQDDDISDSRSILSKASSQNSKYSTQSKNSVASSVFSQEVEMLQKQVDTAKDGRFNIF